MGGPAGGEQCPGERAPRASVTTRCGDIAVAAPLSVGKRAFSAAAKSAGKAFLARSNRSKRGESRNRLPARGTIRMKMGPNAWSIVFAATRQCGDRQPRTDAFRLASVARSEGINWRDPASRRRVPVFSRAKPVGSLCPSLATFRLDPYLGWDLLPNPGFHRTDRRIGTRRIRTDWERGHLRRDGREISRQTHRLNAGSDAVGGTNATFSGRIFRTTDGAT
jgi:hypothetical protein